MENDSLTNDEVIKITALVKIREQAFFTVLRQSGLQPSIISKLKIKHLEKIRDEDTPIPCKIDVIQEAENTKFGRHPSFIGEESVKYLKKYLTKREMTDKEKITQESLLFVTRRKPNNPIIVKEIGRIFKRKAQKVTKGHLKELSLDALKIFFQQKTEEIRGNHLSYLVGENVYENRFKPEEDEFYRKLYKELVLDLLEIEPVTKSMLRIRDNQIKDLTQKFDYLLLGYKDLQQLAKPMIDFSKNEEDAEMTIRMTQKKMSMEEAAAEAEREIEEEKNCQQSQDTATEQETESAQLTKKEHESDKWKKTKEEIDNIPREPREGELLHVVWGDVKVTTTEVEYKRLPSKEPEKPNGSNQPDKKTEKIHAKKNDLEDK
jgi:hypothetical protein